MVKNRKLIVRSWCIRCARAGRSDPYRRRARQDEEEREQHITTWSIDYAFMIVNGDLFTREEMERIGWDKTRDTVLVSEDLATGGIRAHLVVAPVDKDQGRHRRIWTRRCACSCQVGSRTIDC